MDEYDYNFEEMIFDNKMSTEKPRKVQKMKSNGKLKESRKDKIVPRSHFRKANWNSGTDDQCKPDDDKVKFDDKLMHELSDVIRDYSQQRMRALHMSFRSYGNDDSLITHKEMLQALQDNNMSIANSILKPLVSKFGSAKGIHLEALFRFMMDAHARTGRDSVLAMHKRNDLTPRSDVSQEDVDEDLLYRIESELIRVQGFIDLQVLRTEFQKRDIGKCGKIDNYVLQQICIDQQLPVFGALLKNLAKRCDDENNGKISWPEFIAFLDRGQENAWNTCPTLKQVSEQGWRKSESPSPFEELSPETKQVIVSKLKKKRSEISAKKTVSVDLNDNNHGYQEDTDESQYLLETITEGHQPMAQEIDATVTKKSTTDDSDAKGLHDVKVMEIKDIDKVTGEHITDARNNGETKFPCAPTHSNATPPTQSIPASSNQSTPPQLRSEISSSNKALSNISPPPLELKEEISPANAETDNHLLAKVETVKTSQTEVAAVNKGKTAESSKEDNQNKDEHLQMAKVNEAVDNYKIQNDWQQQTVVFNFKGKTLTFTEHESYFQQQTRDPPKERMKLNWVYGYRGNDCRKNIHILAAGEILYFVSYIAIIYNVDSHKQKHYKDHTEDIKCIDVHSNKIIVASGQYASRNDETIKAHVRVWRSDTLQTLHVLGIGQFEKSVACVAFAPGKDLLTCVDNSNEKRLYVWDTNSGQLKGQDALNIDLVCEIGFNSKYPDTLITAGKEHTCWWKIYPDSNTIQVVARPEYDNFLKAKFVICLAFNDKGDLITGDSNGTIYVFGDGGNRITNYIKHAHDGPVFSVTYYKTYIFSGGRDGIVHCWQLCKNMDSAGFVQVPKTEGGIRMLRVWQNRLFVGTTVNSILVINLSADVPLQGAVLEPIPLVQCHYEDLRGLCTLKSSPVDVITAGLDGSIYEYSSSEMLAVSKVQFKGYQYLCFDIDKSGSFLALGTKDGYLHILQRLQGQRHLEETVYRKLCKDRIECIKISPDNSCITAGSHDGCIYVYSYMTKDDGSNAWEFAGKLMEHIGPVTDIDWSQCKVGDNYVLRSSSTDLELKYWIPNLLESYSHSDVTSGMKWRSYTVINDVNVVGILAAKSTSSADVKSIDVNPSNNLAVTGDSHGSISLFRFPCSLSGTFYHSYRSHAVVHCVKFTSCGKYVMTVGGKDSCLMQWEIV